MSPNVPLAEATIARLQGIAEPLVDTYDSVVNKLLDHYDASSTAVVKPGKPIGADSNKTLIFDPASPPQLKFTTCTHITVGGAPLAKQVTYWNNLLIAVVQHLHDGGMDVKQIHAQMTITNAIIGKKEDSGYKFLSEIGLSVQGADANAAFKQAYQLASKNGINFTVDFVWQDNERAAHPNRAGRLEV